MSEGPKKEPRKTITVADDQWTVVPRGYAVEHDTKAGQGRIRLRRKTKRLDDQRKSPDDAINGVPPRG